MPTTAPYGSWKSPITTDLVVAGVYTEKATVQILKSLGVRVEIFPIEQNFDDIVKNIIKMGQLVGHPGRAK